MSDDHAEDQALTVVYGSPLPAAWLDRIAARRKRLEALDELKREETAAMRADLVAARQSGILVKDLISESRWSREWVNQTLREGGIAPNRSAPRKQKNPS